MSSRMVQKKAARVVREQRARERRRKRTLWTAVVAAVVLVLAGLVGFAVFANQKPDTYARPQGATGDGAGIAVGTGAVPVDIYVDFMCPHCKAFETEAGPTLKQLVDEKKITLIYHPVAFLDRASTNQYSTRAAASAGCAADGGKLVEYSDALFVRQPAEGGPGLTDDELIQVGGSVQLVDPVFGQCVRSGRYTSWVRHVTDTASARGVTGTPTVYVAGRVTPASSAAILSAVRAAPK